MSVYEEIYSSGYQPDETRALDVLSFLLMPERAFMYGDSTPEERAAVARVLYDAKRNALLRWYHYVGRRVSG